MYEQLKLANQLCFPLYSLSKAITNRYRPLLQPLGLTYPQYLVMLVLWEDAPLSVNDIGARLQLDSGTLTPLLKRLQNQQLIERQRDSNDERRVLIYLTEAGQALQARAKDVPAQMAACIAATPEDIATLRALLARVVQ